MKFLVYQYTVTILLLLMYLKGYFPIVHHEPIIIQPPNNINGVPLEKTKFYNSQIDRLVFIVIDALRYDFINKEYLPALHENMGCLLKVKVEAPTVTMPRIKALTTGAVPQFIDIVLNLASNSEVEDSFLHQAYAAKRKILFYGDCTWLIMFPNLFTRYDGTTSFFVNDFTEVDNNVTRHVDEELIAKDWDIMVLHYLGLDHIGHVHGPFSDLIKPKLREMDTIINKIISNSKEWNERTMILVTGDHGMKNSGGHGGTTYAETHVPLIVYHNKKTNCKSDRETIISQTDIPNTLSALFGIGMPSNSVGKVIPLLMNNNKAQLLYALHYNSIILQRNSDQSEKYETKLKNARNMFKEFVEQEFHGVYNSMIENLYMENLREMSDKLIASSVKQDSELLLFAILGTANSLISIIINTSRSLHKTSCQNDYITLMVIFLFLFLKLLLIKVYTFLEILLIVSIGLLLLKNLINLLQLIINNFNITELLIKCTPFILHAGLLFSSSYIEEEHYIFYYLLSTVSVVIAFIKYQHIRKITIDTVMPLTVLQIIRLARNIEKDFLQKNENFFYMQLLHASALIFTNLIYCYISGNPQWDKLQSVVLLLIFLQKMYFDRLVEFAQFIWSLIIFSFIINVRRGEILKPWLLIMAFQLRPYNTILLPAVLMCSYIYKCTLKGSHNSKYLITIHSWLGFTFFFLQGHSNSIASIDLAPAYIGLKTYVPTIVGILSLCHSYGFQTLSLLLIFDNCNLSLQTQNKLPEYNKAFGLIVSYRLVTLIAVYSITFIHKEHLFVWSVFAPKLLIESMHTIALFIQVLLFSCYQYLINKLYF